LNLRRTVICTVLGAATLLSIGMPAGADAPNANVGQDGKADTVFLGGSDTTFEVEGRLATLWNQSPGCTTNNTQTNATTDSKYYPVPAPTAGNLAQCSTTADQTLQSNKLNYDHDVAVNLYPTGSSAGINAMLNGYWQVARSSRALKNGTTVEHATEVGFAKDAVVVDTFGNTTPVATGFTKQNLIDIFSCNGTHSTTSTLAGDSRTRSGLYFLDEFFAGAPHKLLIPYGIQTSSGTYATFESYLDPALTKDPSPTAGTGLNCVEPLGNPYARVAPNNVVKGTDYPFENNAAPVLNDAKSKGFVTDGATDAHPGNGNDIVLTWSSLGVFNTYNFKRDGAAYWPLIGSSGVSDPNNANDITTNKYPITRILYRMLHLNTLQKTADAANAVLTNGVNFSSTSASPQDQAALDMTLFACQPNAYYTSAPVNPYSGFSYFSEISTAISLEGFQRPPLSTGERNWGACDTVTQP
jgi:ABC-type phosphate transport system substrate-binding protein